MPSRVHAGRDVLVGAGHRHESFGVFLQSIPHRIGSCEVENDFIGSIVDKVCRDDDRHIAIPARCYEVTKVVFSQKMAPLILSVSGIVLTNQQCIVIS